MEIARRATFRQTGDWDNLGGGSVMVWGCMACGDPSVDANSVYDCLLAKYTKQRVVIGDAPWGV